MDDVIDGPILNYLFQPIVNRFTEHPVDVAMQFAIGGAVNLGAASLIRVHWPDWSSLSIALGVLGCQGMGLYGLRMGCRAVRRLIVPGARNPLRVGLLPLRFGVVSTLVWSVILLSADFDLANGFAVVGAGLYAASFYFYSCDHPPSQPQRQRRSRVARLVYP